MKSPIRAMMLMIIMAVVCSLSSCEKNPMNAGSSSQGSTSHQPITSLKKVTVTENFESGTKTAYAAANVTLTSGVWNFNDALIGTSSSDRKNGSQSVRARNSAIVAMTFDVTTGASTVTVLHALYGSDASSTWQLWYSTNSGSSWMQVGSTVTTSSTTLQTANFTVNVSGTVRFEIKKTDGSSNRINFDDFTVNDYSSGGSGSGGGSSSEHLVLGNPTSAVTDTNTPNNYLMVKPQYVLSYNRSKSETNWTAWHLSASWLGSAARQDDFRADTSLPKGWYQVQGTSFSGSGYDRGHMCPSADRTVTVTDNSATFLMTNMVPQSANNNEGPWEVLEDSCRALVTGQNKELYVYSGGYGSQGTINNGHVTVPSYTWKIAVVMDKGKTAASNVTTSTRVIAVWMPNSDSQISKSANWKSYRVSVDYIESQTGYDFLSNVSTSIQSVIESKTDSM